jgi:hypothetical protein
MLHILQVFQRYVASVSEVVFKMFRLFQTYVASVPIWMLHIFHTYVATKYLSNVSTIFSLMLQYMFSCCKLQVFYLVLHMFDTHVTSVCSRCFIRFIRMLHSSVSCCLESQGVRGIDGGTTRAQENGPRRAGG